MAVASSGAPVAGANVCVKKGDEVYAIGKTDASGSCSLVVHPTTAGTMSVTVTTFDNLPYEGVVNVQRPFGRTAPPPGWISPGWNWISFPLEPDDPRVSAILGPAALNRLYRWDTAGKSMQCYPGDFTTVEPGRGYMLYAGAIMAPTYRGTDAAPGFEIPLPCLGWTWIGTPYDSVTPQANTTVINHATGEQRTAVEDWSDPNPWVNWNWVWWDSYSDTAKTCCLAPGADTANIEPWHAYRVWTNVDNLGLSINR